MVLFEVDFLVGKTVSQKIRCTIVYDTFILAIQQPKSLKADQEIEEKNWPRRSEYVEINSDVNLSPINRNSPLRLDEF